MIKDLLKSSKLFAFFGMDLEGYPENFLEKLDKDRYTLLALDSRAIELASKSDIPYTIINDWLGTETMLDIQNIAWDCENNWFNRSREEFTSNGVCWPEFDHTAMNYFWLDVITSFKLADIFRRYGINQILIVKQIMQDPVLYYWQGSVCKVIWENELADRIKIIESKEMPINLKINNAEITSTRFLPLLYSSPKNLTGKIAFFASETELGRSTDALQDLLTTFPKEVVIIPNAIPEHRICHHINKWSVPIITIAQSSNDDKQLREKFTNGFQNVIIESKGKVWEKSLDFLRFHFLYYCQYRWPMLSNVYAKYLDLFSKNPPKLVIGSVVTITEWQLPILAASQCGIKTVSIPHSITIATPTISVPQITRELKFDYHLNINPISKKILSHICSINDKKFIACKNCTDLNSYSVKPIEHPFSKSSFNILVLFSSTSLYVYPTMQSRLIYPIYKNPKTQIKTIKIFNSPPKDLRDKLSIKFKVHPGFSELQLFNAAGVESLERLLPTDSDLESVLDEADLVIGVNFFSSAFFLALENQKPYVCFNNDDFFEHSLLLSELWGELFGNSITIVHTSEELWNLIRIIVTDFAILTQMKSDVSIFSDKFLDNSDYPTIGKAIEEILQKDKNN